MNRAWWGVCFFGVFVAAVIGLSQFHPSYAETAREELAPSAYFDFWLGEWELTWQDADGGQGKGRNTIRRILDGAVIEERFEAVSGVLAGFRGQSYSVFDERTETWKQTWVDSNGAYLDFVGAFSGERRIFKREAVDQSGNTIQQRMVFHDISDDAFTWDWERSNDGGESWTLRWRIHYQRMQDSEAS